MTNNNNKFLVSRPKKKRLPNFQFGAGARIQFQKLYDKNQWKSRTYISSKASAEVFFNTCFDKNNLKTMIAWFLEQYGEKMTVDLVETLKQVGFHQATCAGVSLGVDDLQIPPQKATLLSHASLKMETVQNDIQAGNLTSVEKSQRLIDTWNQTSETLRQTAVQNFRTTNPVNPVYMMAFSGARGNISQVRQLVAMRGLMADPQGAILEFPIQSNFREGLTVTEYLISCYGARKGLVDTALRTATSGYLTRRLVDAVQHVVVHVADCQTKKGICIKDKNIEQRLVGRILLEDIHLNASLILKKNTLISQRLAKQIAVNHKEVRVRSPLTCQTEKSVCQLCYGLDLAQGKLVSIGETVGIIAAQSIGEPGTQLTMRTFHTGGVGVFSDQALKSFLAPFDGKIHFLESLPGLFVRTPHGNIVYLLKHKNCDETKPLLRLTPLANGIGVYEIPHVDIPAGSLLWVKQGECVKSGQLLIQASRLQTATQEMPESSHPVHSPLSGQVFFQSMSIRVIEEEKRSIQKSKKKKQQKEISPTFPTLIELGNFWVFSSFIQKEFGFSNSFFVRGDIVSQNTPIHQYNLHVPNKGQIKRHQSSIILGYKSLDFLFTKICYSHLFYFLLGSGENNEPTVISYTTTSTQSVLTWYPSLKNFSSISSGYCSLLDKNPFSLSTSEKNVNLLKGSNYTEARKSENPQNLDFLWAPHPVFRFKTVKSDTQGFLTKTSLCPQGNSQKNQPFVHPYFLFSLGNQTLSKKGLFQTESGLESPNIKKICFEKNFRKNPLKPQKSPEPETLFLKKALKNVDVLLSEHSDINLIENRKTWFYIPKKVVSSTMGSQKPRVVLEPGKTFENLIFDHASVFTNLINSHNFLFLKSKKERVALGSFYSVQDLLNWKKEFSLDLSKTLSRNQSVNNSLNKEFPEDQLNSFCFYKKQQNLNVKDFDFLLKRKQKVSLLISFQKNTYYRVANAKIFKQKWLVNKKTLSPQSINSPLFTKQYKTSLHTKPPTMSFQMRIPSHSGWYSSLQLVKTEFKLNSSKTLKKREQLQQKLVLNTTQKENLGLGRLSSSNVHEVQVSAFSLFFYRSFTLKNTTEFCLQTFYNGWILPEYTITSAFLKSQKVGEFLDFQQKQDQTCLSFLRNQDMTTLKLSSDTSKHWSKDCRVGTPVRWGHELVSGSALARSGQIVKLTKKTVTLRKGIPLVASIRGLIHISHNDFIEKNDLLITLRSRRLQTEDIVQGIPKIEQLFEARETQGGEIIQNNMHSLLQSFFARARRVKPRQEAVQLSLAYIQKVIVSAILEAYSTQGVHIAEKHVEVVVRQMTARVRITQGGDSGLLPGELIQLRLLEKVNERLSQLGRRQAYYEPVILGITKSVLQSESFLLAASFQQVSQVLVRSALAKKTDFLRGLHENVLVGQAIPAGTGIIDWSQSLRQSSQGVTTKPKEFLEEINSLEADSHEKSSF